MQVYFETLQIHDNKILVWLHHPHRMLICDLKYLQQRQEQEGGYANPFENKSFILYPSGFTEYKMLAPALESKMPLLVQVRSNESLATTLESSAVNNAVDQFVLSHDEMNRILNTTKSVSNVIRI
jgi:hypothetical protein